MNVSFHYRRASSILLVLVVCSACTGRASGIPLIDAPLPQTPMHPIVSKTTPESYQAAWDATLRMVSQQGGQLLVQDKVLGLIVYSVSRGPERTYYNVQLSPSRLGAGTVVIAIPQLRGARATADDDGLFFRGFDESLNAIGTR